MADVSRLAQVECVEPRWLYSMRRHQAAAAPRFDDPLLGAQWWIETQTADACLVPGAAINLPAAWDITTGRAETVIAVLDTGMDLGHPELASQLFPRGEDDWNFTLQSAKEPVDAAGHGTAVAGLAAAIAGNDMGITGVAPGCRLMPLKIDGLDLVFNLIDALEYLTEKAQARRDLRFVVNASFGIGGQSTLVESTLRNAREAGIVLCFSAGNDGGAVDYPASSSEVIAVGAVIGTGERKTPRDCTGETWASARGPELDLVAPGVAMVTTDIRNAGGYEPGDFNPKFNGTSAAAPLVAGVAALMLSANPDLTALRVQEILAETALDGAGSADEDTPGFDEFMGWGRLDAGAAVLQAARERLQTRGDGDCSDEVDGADVVAVLGHLFLGRPAPCRHLLDASGDGRVGIEDPVYLLNWLYRGGPPPLEYRL